MQKAGSGMIEKLSGIQRPVPPPECRMQQLWRPRPLLSFRGPSNTEKREKSIDQSVNFRIFIVKHITNFLKRGSGELGLHGMLQQKWGLNVERFYVLAELGWRDNTAMFSGQKIHCGYFN